MAEYAPQSGTPLRILKSDIAAPVALAMNPSGLLFVANDPLVQRRFGLGFRLSAIGKRTDS